MFVLPNNKIIFPHPELANDSGILAVGGDLSPERLLLAYQIGIFPWFDPDEPILWWCPDPRFVLFPDELKISKSMRPYFNQKKFNVTLDTQFEAIMRSCQTNNRKGQGGGSWISEAMIEAYCTLHRLGFAHSVEVWQGEVLAGGLYGISMGKCFFGESMFAKVSNASKFGFITLVLRLQALGFKLIDCQQQTRHLGSLGARAIPRKDFLKMLKINETEPNLTGSWTDSLNP